MVRRPRLVNLALWSLLLSACAASAVAGRLCYLARPFDSDAAMFAFMGRLVSDGGRVGPDLVDNKFPTVGLMMTAAWRACGTSWTAYVLFGTALSILATAALAAAARRGGGDPRAAALFAAVLLNLTPAVFGGFQLETPIACFTCLAAASAAGAIVEGSVASAFTAGLAAGCAAMLKPTGAGVLLALLVGVGVARRNVGPLVLATLAGLAVPLAAAAAYLSTAHLWGELPATARRLSAYAEGSVVDAVSALKLATVVALLGAPLLVGWIAGRRERASGSSREPLRTDLHVDATIGPNDPARPLQRAGEPSPRNPPAEARGPSHPMPPERPASPVVAFALAWLAIELAGIVAQRRMYAYHFLPLVPPAALLFGLLPPQRRPLPLLAALGPAVALGLCCAARVMASPTDARLPVGRYLAARAVPGDRVWSDDCPRLLIETGLRPGSRQPLTFLFANDDAAAGTYSAQIVADLDRDRPAYVVLPVDLPRWLRRQTAGIVELADRPARAAAYVAGWRRIERYTLAHYRRDAVIGDAAVYRRSDAAAVADVGR